MFKAGKNVPADKLKEKYVKNNFFASLSDPDPHQNVTDLQNCIPPSFRMGCENVLSLLLVSYVAGLRPLESASFLSSPVLYPRRYCFK
jgi:hypothetical protein